MGAVNAQIPVVSLIFNFLFLNTFHFLFFDTTLSEVAMVYVAASLWKDAVPTLVA